MTSEETIKVRFDDTKEHVWINGEQYVSLKRFIEVREAVNREMRILSDEVKRLTEENNAYKTLLKNSLAE